MAKEDPVHEFLREKGCGQHTVDGGLPGLIEAWEQVVKSVEDGYSLGLDDYLNDLDVRQLIEDAMLVATATQHDEFSERIELADETMRASVEAAGGCLWGDEVAEEEGWTARRNWWYFSRPLNANANPELLAEIDDAIGPREG